MKKLYSLIRACMTSDMRIFKIKTKKNSKSAVLLPLFIALYLMFMMWGSANSLFEKLSPLKMDYLLLSLFVFGISFMTFIEGIYKIGSLVFNCKDDDLLLSLPIKKRTILFIRVFKFYIFELLFNSLFLLPIMIAYIRWANNLTWTYYLTSLIMLIFLPVIPIVLSLIVGTITTSIASHFKYKNAAQVILSMTLILGILFISYDSEGMFNYLLAHATSINDLITKIYYPAGLYASLVLKFNFTELLLFILINVVIFVVAIFILAKFYFKINSRLKRVTTAKKIKIDNLVIKSKSVYKSLILKELNTFFKTPVFIVNAGFALVLFVIATIIMAFKFDMVIPILINQEGLNISKDLIMNNLSILIFALILVAAYMTSITNSVISLEGKNINILKSLPLKTKTILMSKIYASLVITTPMLLIGDMVLFIRFKIGVIDSLLLVILSILIPLVSHFVGLLVNLKYPKLDYENSTEVVKQSASSFISVIIGMVLLIINITIIVNIIGVINATIILVVANIVYLVLDVILYLYLVSNGAKRFDNLSI